MISFNTIPMNILTPGNYVEFDSSRAVQGLPLMPHRILVIAPRLASGTVAALTPTRIRSAAEGELACGRGSIGAAMLAAARTANPYTELHMIGVAENGGGVAATGTLTITGPSTAAGSIALYIAGKRIEMAVASGAAQNAIATALGAAINADTSLPVTASVTTNVVTLTARYKGTTGNDIDVRLNYALGEALPAGVAIALVAMASGATNPDVAAALAALGDTQYHTIVTPFNDATSLASVETFLAARWSGMIQKEGHAFAAYYGTLAGISTLVDARNSPHLSAVSTQKSPTPQWVFAAVLGAIDAGQAEDPSNCSRPRQTLALTGCLPPKLTDRYTREERQTHLEDGAATFLVDDGGVCRIERLVTTYKTSNGVPDTAYMDVEVMRGLAYLRYSTRVRIALRYPRHKLAANGTPIPPGQAIVTPNAVRDELIALFQDWQGVGLVEDIAQFKRDLIVEINSTDPNRIDAIIPPNVINGFRVFAASVQFRL